VNLLVLASGIMGRLLTTVFFPGQAANETDPVLLSLPAALRSRLVAVPDGMENGVPVFRFDLLLHGSPEAETPFFED
jgi:protocatechuate 3,4-dioxygenase, alpha subunit